MIRPDMEKNFSQIRTQLGLGAKVLQLVFQSSPKWASFYFLTNAASSIIPTVNLYVGKLIIDAVVAAVRRPTQANIDSVVLLALLAFLGEATNSLFANLATHGFDVMKDIFAKFAIGKVLRQSALLDISYFEDPRFQDQLEKVQREIYFRPTQAMNDIVELATSLIGLVSLLAILLRLAWWAPLILAVFSLPRLVFRLKFAYKTYAITDSRSPFQRALNQIIWLLTNKYPAKEIKVFGLGGYLLSQFDRMNNRFITENRALSRTQNSYSFLLDLFGSVVYYLLALFAAFQAILSKITLGDLTMYTGTIRQFQNVLQGTFAYTARFYQHNLFLSHYFDFVGLKPKITDHPHPRDIPGGAPLTIRFDNVTFGYEPGKPILKNINLMIQNPRNLALVGENGAGKSTLVKLLLRLYDPSSGRILLNGVDIRDIAVDSLRENISIVFQDYRAYDLTVRENIGFGRVDNIRDTAGIKKAATLSGAREFIEKFPDQYETMLGRSFVRGQELSGGQWQKIALARGFFKNAPFLILDEPTSALDPKSEYDVFKNLITHTKNKSLVLISHRFSTVRLADEIIVLHRGQIVERGTHEELMKKKGRYQRLYDLQARWYR